jgi:glycosyltransferase involved in cell wall biosynthesis
MADAPLSFSVAIPNMGRTEELAALLRSIGDSSILPAQIIVVDQNSDDRLTPVIAAAAPLDVEHHRVAFKGLSAAKNYAARVATGEVLFTPDDDCRVFPDTFESALKEIASSGADVVFGKCIDEKGQDSIVKYRAGSGWLTSGTMDGMFVEPATAVRTAVLREIQFDETLGVGTFHGAEEGYDWVLRLLAAKKRLFFQPSIRFYHPRTITDYGSEKARSRVYSYRCGYGRLCRKHGLWGRYAKRVGLVMGGIVAYSVTDRAKARYYMSELAGLVAGATVEPR